VSYPKEETFTIRGANLNLMATVVIFFIRLNHACIFILSRKINRHTSLHSEIFFILFIII
jgi:hypothetical protein